MNCECPASAGTPRAIIRLRYQPTMGQALETFRRIRNLSRADLASWLSVDEDILDRMADLRRPEPSEADFLMQCLAIARHTSGDAFALRTMLRWLRTHG